MKRNQKKYKLALHWHTKAAEQENYFSQFRLGEMCSNGKGVSINYKNAFQWYKKAANQNYIKSQIIIKSQATIGIMYIAGQGVQSDKIQAYKWLSIAMAGGDKIVSDFAEKFLNGLTPEMTLAEINTAQAKAMEWWENKKSF